MAHHRVRNHLSVEEPRCFPASRWLIIECASVFLRSIRQLVLPQCQSTSSSELVVTSTAINCPGIVHCIVAFLASRWLIIKFGIVFHPNLSTSVSTSFELVTTSTAVNCRSWDRPNYRFFSRTQMVHPPQCQHRHFDLVETSTALNCRKLGLSTYRRFPG